MQNRSPRLFVYISGKGVTDIDSWRAIACSVAGVTGFPLDRQTDRQVISAPAGGCHLTRLDVESLLVLRVLSRQPFQGYSSGDG